MGKVYVIAEAGINHNGNIKIAKKMIDTALSAGADAVKFQTFKAEKIISRFSPKAAYQKKPAGKEDSHLAMIKRLELDVIAHRELIGYCRKRGIIFLSSPFDLESIDLLNKFGLEIFKIPSGEITNLPYLKKIGALKKKCIISTGMADMGEIKAALSILIEAGTRKKDVTVLHCTTEYPAPFEEVNLSAMLTIRDALKVNVGYSDHTLGIEVSVAAAALGAVIIEKHFTLDKNMEGPDHKASLDPDELKRMIAAIRNIEKALGSGIKRPSLSEKRNKLVVRKSVVASRDIKKGEIFTEDNITVKRPGAGISPMRWDEIIGKAAGRDFNEDEMIKL